MSKNGILKRVYHNRKKKNKSDTYPGVGPPSPRLNTCLGLSKYWNLCSNLFFEKKKIKEKEQLTLGQDLSWHQ